MGKVLSGPLLSDRYKISLTSSAKAMQNIYDYESAE